MRDPLTWSIPLGRLFGIQIKVHLLFPLIALGLILRATTHRPPAPEPPSGVWLDAVLLTLFLRVAVLLHEFGHCFAARAVDGDAQEILLWPLGGLANVDVPQTPRAHFLTAAAGPAVNFGLALLAGALLYSLPPEGALRPSLDPTRWPPRVDATGAVLYAWHGGDPVRVPAGGWQYSLGLFFWANWMLGLLNVVLMGFPLDGGRMLQAALWPRWGYRQATLVAVFVGFAVMFVLAVYAILDNDMLPLCLAAFMYFACKNQWIILETGGEESLFGYDFSQGYTSLERDLPQATARPRRVGWFTRWKQKRTAQRLQREAETRVSEERRMDELLEKVQREGITALTDEERRFMKRVSDRYKNRH